MQDLLDSMNASELLLLAQETNPNAHRGLPRETLILLTLGEDADLPPRKVDKTRLLVMQWIDANFKQVSPIVQGCPARTRDLRACFQCTDVQATECALTNSFILTDKNTR